MAGSAERINLQNAKTFTAVVLNRGCAPQEGLKKFTGGGAIPYMLYNMGSFRSEMCPL